MFISFWTELPWTLALKGKRVLVVHPFAESIKSQSCRRNLIFKNQNIWPEYNLITLCAVQSNAGNNVSFRDWFEALKWMEDEIAKIDFDICILGCGAYGLPLAATIKRMGKKQFIWGEELSFYLALKVSVGITIRIIGRICLNSIQIIVVFIMNIG